MRTEKTIRLIEESFPVAIVSKVGTNERYLHGRTPHTLHVWWARRPFSAMRAVVFSSLLPASSEESVKENNHLTERLASSVDPLSSSVTQAKSILLKHYHRPPRVLDIFGGGGTIAFEAARLGCAAVSVELNPLAHFIQRTILQYSQTPSNLADLVWEHGRLLLHNAEKETVSLYGRCSSKKGEERLAFIWGYTVPCKKCGNPISLSHMGWISKKKDRKMFLEQTPNLDNGTYIRKLHFNPTHDPRIGIWTTTGGVSCPFCNSRHPKKELQKLTTSALRDDLLCVCSTFGKYKTYTLPEDTNNVFPSQKELDHAIQIELDRIGCPLPRTELPHWSGIVNPPLYGIRTHVQMFNSRQLLVLLKVIRGLRETYARLVDCGSSPEVSLAVTSILSGFVDQLVDWNCRISMWIEENEQVGRALSGPGIPMLWNYAEIDPFSSGPANLPNKLNRIINGLKAIPRFEVPVEVYMGSATQLSLGDGLFDAIVTDPPYGDNLFYSVLSECIYVWKRMVFRDILPEIFGPERISSEKEIVAAHYGRASFSEAMNFYEENLAKALSEAKSLLNPEGVLSLVFSHGTLDAWEVIVHTFRKAKLSISTCVPMALERRARPRGMNSKAVNTSFVIVARHAVNRFQVVEWDSLRGDIEKEVSHSANYLRGLGWDDVDIGLACFGTTVGKFVAFDVIEEGKILSTRECLERCSHIVEETVPSFSLHKRNNKS